MKRHRYFYFNRYIFRVPSLPLCDKKLEDMNKPACLELFKASPFIQKALFNEIPLLKLMDAEIGLGYPVSRTQLNAPLIDSMTFSYPTKDYGKVRWSKQTSFLANKLSVALLEN